MKKLKGKVPDCASCKPKVLESNLEVLFLVERYQSTMFTESGLSGGGILLALEAETWVEDNDKSDYANRIMIYLGTLRAAIQRKN